MVKLQAKLDELDTVAFRTRPRDVMVWTAPYTAEREAPRLADSVLGLDHLAVVIDQESGHRLLSPEDLKAEYAPTRPRTSEPTPKPKPRQRRSK